MVEQTVRALRRVLAYLRGHRGRRWVADMPSRKEAEEWMRRWTETP